MGGNTIARAKQEMSYLEFSRWAEYIRRRGSLNVGTRVEDAGALLAALFANYKTKNGGNTVYDFAPHRDRPAITLEEAMNSWG